jgi:hypothetical protein
VWFPLGLQTAPGRTSAMDQRHQHPCRRRLQRERRPGKDRLQHRAPVGGRERRHDLACHVACQCRMTRLCLRPDHLGRGAAPPRRRGAGQGLLPRPSLRGLACVPAARRLRLFQGACEEVPSPTPRAQACVRGRRRGRARPACGRCRRRPGRRGRGRPRCPRCSGTPTGGARPSPLGSASPWAAARTPAGATAARHGLSRPSRAAHANRAPGPPGAWTRWPLCPPTARWPDRAAGLGRRRPAGAAPWWPRAGPGPWSTDRAARWRRSPWWHACGACQRRATAATPRTAVLPPCRALQPTGPSGGGRAGPLGRAPPPRRSGAPPAAPQAARPPVAAWPQRGCAPQATGPPTAGGSLRTVSDPWGPSQRLLAGTDPCPYSLSSCRRGNTPLGRSGQPIREVSENIRLM